MIESINTNALLYTAIDGILALWTIFHILIAAAYMAVPDASYKKTLIKLHYKIHSPITKTPFLIPLTNTLTTILVAFLCSAAYENLENSAAVLRAAMAVHSWAASFFLQRMSNTLVNLGVDYVMKIEQDIQTHDIKTWTEPPKWTGDFVASATAWFLRPQLFGAENMPTDQPGFYVSNHSLFGVEMAPFLHALYNAKDILPRSLADHFHFGQLHGEFIRYFGGVDGTRANVDTLMETKQNLLVYPGGGHEIMKPCSVPKYTLMWKERLGFARCAIKHGYPIVPCCSVGTEDMFLRLFDVPAGFMGKNMKIPASIILPHKLQRAYFWVGEPIPTAQYKGDYQNDEFAREVRDKVKAALEAGIEEMKQKQANDPNRYLLAAIANSFLSLFGCGPEEPEVVEQPKKARRESGEWEALSTVSETDSDSSSVAECEPEEESKKNL